MIDNPRFPCDFGEEWRLVYTMVDNPPADTMSEPKRRRRESLSETLQMRSCICNAMPFRCLFDTRKQKNEQLKHLFEDQILGVCRAKGKQNNSPP